MAVIRYAVVTQAARRGRNPPERRPEGVGGCLPRRTAAPAMPFYPAASLCFTPQQIPSSLPSLRARHAGRCGAQIRIGRPLLPCAGARPRPAPPNRQTAPFPSIHESVTSARSWASLQQAAGSGGWNFLLFCNTSFYFFLPSIFLKQENGASHREP